MLGGVDKWIYGFIGLGVFAAIGAIVLTSVRDNAITACASGFFNSTSGVCQVSASNSSFLSNVGVEWLAANNSLTATSNLTAQFGTAGTLAGLGVLALAAVMIMLYFRNKDSGDQ